jgi:hypothetical protein
VLWFAALAAAMLGFFLALACIAIPQRAGAQGLTWGQTAMHGQPIAQR